ncbi:MAG: hypothetical protein ABMB14_40595, partial [Myxococcota bacterium]
AHTVSQAAAVSGSTLPGVMAQLRTGSERAFSTRTFVWTAAAAAPPAPVPVAVRAIPAWPPVGTVMVSPDDPPWSPRGRRLRERAPVDLPPLRLAFGTGLQPDLQPSFAAWFGQEFVRIGRTTLGYDLYGALPHGLPSGLLRTVSSIEADLVVRVPLGGRFAFGPAAGLSFRWYRQQFTAIDDSAMPVVGATLSAAPVVLPPGRWRFTIDLQTMADVGSTQLVDEAGAVFQLVPIEFRLGFGARFGGTRDPFSTDPTSIPVNASRVRGDR